MRLSESQSNFLVSIGDITMLGYGATEVDNAIHPRVEGTSDLFISLSSGKEFFAGG